MAIPSQDDLTYGEKLMHVARWYCEHQASDGGWSMQFAETEDLTGAPGLVSTAYVLALLRYAGVPFEDPVVQRGLDFILQQPHERWSSTRHPVYTILALTEWSHAVNHPSRGPADAFDRDAAHRRIDFAVDWLAKNTVDGGWPVAISSHRCAAWSAKAIYALGRLRLRSAAYRLDGNIRRLIEVGANRLLADQIIDGPTQGAWPVCGMDDEPSVANTALCVIGLSHRYVEAVEPGSEAARWGSAYRGGAQWLLRNHALWESNESGEDDPLAHDGWQYATFALAARACLSAGVPPEHPHLSRGLNFVFSRWLPRPFPGWRIHGKGVTAYSSWSVVQVGQVLRLAISREDPIRVLRAMQQGPTRFQGSAEVRLTLDRPTRLVLAASDGAEPRVVEMRRQDRRFRLLEAFAEREIRPGGQLSLEILGQFLDDGRRTADTRREWNALKALAHETNEAVRAALGDRSVQVFRSTIKPEHALIAVATITFTPAVHEIEPLAGEDVSVIERS